MAAVILSASHSRSPPRKGAAGSLQLCSVSVFISHVNVALIFPLDAALTACLLVTDMLLANIAWIRLEWLVSAGEEEGCAGFRKFSPLHCRTQPSGEMRYSRHV